MSSNVEASSGNGTTETQVELDLHALYSEFGNYVVYTREFLFAKRVGGQENEEDLDAARDLLVNTITQIVEHLKPVTKTQDNADTLTLLLTNQGDQLEAFVSALIEPPHPEDEAKAEADYRSTADDLAEFWVAAFNNANVQLTEVKRLLKVVVDATLAQARLIFRGERVSSAVQFEIALEGTAELLRYLFQSVSPPSGGSCNDNNGNQQSYGGYTAAKPAYKTPPAKQAPVYKNEKGTQPCAAPQQQATTPCKQTVVVPCKQKDPPACKPAPVCQEQPQYQQCKQPVVCKSNASQQTY